MTDDVLTAALENWRAIEQATTSGPWKPAYRTWTEISDERCAEAWIIAADGREVAMTYQSGPLEPDDADETEQFIVMTRTAFPRLLAAIEAVLKLHEPVDRGAGPQCKGCATHITFTRWPCKTVEAVTCELTGDPP